VFLEKWQRNAIFEAVTEAELNPRDFELEGDGDEARIRVRGSKSIFVVGRDGSAAYRVSKAVGEGSLVGYLAHSWDGVLNPPLSLWLGEVKRDLETPDLWAEIGKQPLAAMMEGEANTPFSEEEQKRIAEAVAEVKEQARETYALPAEQMRLLEAKLDYLVEAASRSRRIDWLNTAIGAVAGAAAGGILTPDVVHGVLTALGAGLGPLFGHPMPLLGP
jgi:hypothetical protein